MAVVTRVILRVDLVRLSTAIMDAPGSVIEQLYQSPDDYWSDITETPSRRLISARAEGEGQLREINVLPASVDLLVEYGLTPPSIETLTRNDTFNEVGLTVDRILSFFGAYEIRRIGIRLFCLASSNVKESGTSKALEEAIPQGLTEPVKKVLGDLSDVGFTLEGRTDEGVGYRLSFGPHLEKDMDQLLLPKLKVEEKDHFIKGGYNLVFDIDQFDENIDFSSLTVKKWARHKIENMAKVVEAVTHSVEAV